MSEEWEWELLEEDIEVVDENELVVDEEAEEFLGVEPVAEDGLQMVDKPAVGVNLNRVGQTHQKFNLIRQEKPAGKRKYMGKAKTW